MEVIIKKNFVIASNALPYSDHITRLVGREIYGERTNVNTIDAECHEDHNLLAIECEHVSASGS